jgi:hypothetical protein
MTTTVEPGSADGTQPAVPAADDDRVGSAEEELARQLAERARAEGLSLTGPGGLLGRLTKVVLESALEGEMDAHLGYARHDRAGDGSGNSRNGHRDKTVLTGAGPVQVSVPRDRDSSFEPPGRFRAGRCFTCPFMRPCRQRPRGRGRLLG